MGSKQSDGLGEGFGTGVFERGQLHGRTASWLELRCEKAGFVNYIGRALRSTPRR